MLNIEASHVICLMVLELIKLLTPAKKQLMPWGANFNGRNVATA